MFALDQVEVRGAPPGLEHEVQDALEPLHGESLLAFRGGQAGSRLAAIPEVAGASFDRAFPHTLRVTVEPEHPVAVLRQASSAWLAASSGRILRSQPANAHPRYPRIWIPASTKVTVGGGLPYAAGLRALRALWDVKRTGFGARIRFVRTSSVELTLVLRTGVELRLGELDRLPLETGHRKPLGSSDVEAPQKGPPYLDLTVPERPVASASESQVVG